jgi:hypothetical protein
MAQLLAGPLPGARAAVDDAAADGAREVGIQFGAGRLQRVHRLRAGVGHGNMANGNCLRKRMANLFYN